MSLTQTHRLLRSVSHGYILIKSEQCIYAVSVNRWDYYAREFVNSGALVACLDFMCAIF